MSKLVLGLLLFVAQLSGPGSTLPQILHPEFKVAGPAGPMKAGQPGEVTVSFNLLKGYAINHKPPISLKLTKISGVTLVKTDFATPRKIPNPKTNITSICPRSKCLSRWRRPESMRFLGSLHISSVRKPMGFAPDKSSM